MLLFMVSPTEVLGTIPHRAAAALNLHPVDLQPLLVLNQKEISLPDTVFLLPAAFFRSLNFSPLKVELWVWSY